MGQALAKAGIQAVLTGGGCAVIYSGSEHQSEDLSSLGEQDEHEFASAVGRDLGSNLLVGRVLSRLANITFRSYIFPWKS